jgi:hypothetical protein
MVREVRSLGVAMSSGRARRKWQFRLLVTYAFIQRALRRQVRGLII